jgi:hypothetical protein
MIDSDKHADAVARLRRRLAAAEARLDAERAHRAAAAEDARRARLAEQAARDSADLWRRLAIGGRP